MFSLILDKAPNLEYLDIGQNELEYATMQSLASVCQNLQHLDMFCCSMYGIGFFLSGIAGMNITKLTWCSVTDTIPFSQKELRESEFEKAIHTITSFQRLKILEIMAAQDDQLKTKHIAKLIIGLPQLESLRPTPRHFRSSKHLINEDLLLLLNADKSLQSRTVVLNLLVKDNIRGELDFAHKINKDFITDKVILRDFMYGRNYAAHNHDNEKYLGFYVESRYQWDQDYMQSWLESIKSDPDYNDEFEAPVYEPEYDEFALL